MELQLINNHQTTVRPAIEAISTSRPFIEANTIEYTLEEIKEGHIIPVFIKDNETVISHADFIEAFDKNALDKRK